MSTDMEGKRFHPMRPEALDGIRELERLDHGMEGERFTIWRCPECGWYHTDNGERVRDAAPWEICQGGWGNEEHKPVRYERIEVIPVAGRRDFTLLQRVADALPGWRDHGQGSFSLSFDAGRLVWEVEVCALDPRRNFSLEADSLADCADALDRFLAQSEDRR
jgi:hypothetical protein